MAPLIVVGIIAVVGAVVGYMGQQSAASSAKKQYAAEAAYREEQAAQAKERADQEARLERERVAYESNLAKENAAYEIGIAEENANVAISQKSKQYQLVRAAQIAGASAAGLTPMGSTWAVMERTTAEHNVDVGEVNRALSIFSTTRQKEAEEVAKGGEFGLTQFLARSTRETTYEVTNRLAEASMFRAKGSAVSAQSKYAAYGAILQVAGAGSKAYGMSKLTATQRYGILASGSFRFD